MAIQDKYPFIINGTAIEYVGDPSFTTGGPTVDTSGQFGGAPFHTFNYENNYSTIKITIKFTDQKEVLINQIIANNDNNTISFGRNKYVGVVLVNRNVERKYGMDIELEFRANPISN